MGHTLLARSCPMERLLSISSARTDFFMSHAGSSSSSSTLTLLRSTTSLLLPPLLPPPRSFELEDSVRLKGRELSKLFPTALLDADTRLACFGAARRPGPEDCPDLAAAAALADPPPLPAEFVEELRPGALLAPALCRAGGGDSFMGQGHTLETWRACTPPDKPDSPQGGSL